MRAYFLGVSLAAVAIGAVSCAGAKRPDLQPTANPGADVLWQRLRDLSSADLFHGPWGAEHAPNPHATYRLLELKHSGVNAGMTVVDPEGREWSVKQDYPGGLDGESRVEVTLSRILSGIGYHQPPVYYLPAFTLKDDWGTHVERGGRFRLKDASLKDKGPWPWETNPFVGSQPYQGLLVMLMMFNSTDLKNANNSLYEHRSGDRVEHWYVVRDLGAALGDTNRLAPFKGHIESFERQPFIPGVAKNGQVDFAYKGWYRNLVRDRISAADVGWACRQLAQLHDQQWRDAFRAGGYEPPVAERFIAALRQKIDRGRSLARQSGF